MARDKAGAEVGADGWMDDRLIVQFEEWLSTGISHFASAHAATNAYFGCETISIRW